MRTTFIAETSFGEYEFSTAEEAAVCELKDPNIKARLDELMSKQTNISWCYSYACACMGCCNSNLIKDGFNEYHYKIWKKLNPDAVAFKHSLILPPKKDMFIKLLKVNNMDPWVDAVELIQVVTGVGVTEALRTYEYLRNGYEISLHENEMTLDEAQKNAEKFEKYGCTVKIEKVV